MSSIFYLAFLRAKGKVRRAYSSFGSGVLTTISIIVMLLVALFFATNKPPITMRMPFNMAIGAYLGFIFIMAAAIFMQKHEALIESVDAHNLISGPYTTRDLIIYGSLTSLSNVALYTFISFGYLGMMMLPLSMAKNFDYFYVLLVSCLMYLTVFSFYDMLYIRFMTNKHRVLIRRSIIITLALIVAAIFAYYYLINGGNEFEHIISEFIDSDLFSLVPIFGWGKYSMIMMHRGETLPALISLFGIILVNIVIIGLTVNTKEIDVEVLIDDSEKIENIKKNANNNIYANLEAKSIKNVSFKTGASAISSRLFVEMRKTRSFITTQEIVFVIMYLAISIFDGFDFAFYSRYILIILFIITNSANYNDELKHHYIYLIPDKPIKKLIALILPTIFKLTIVIIATLTFGIILKPTAIEFVSAFIEVMGYGLLFVSANIWSLRILKQGNNPVANQFIKMLLIVVASLPSIILGLLFSFLLNDLQLYSIVCSLINILVACLFIYASKGVVTGADLIDN